MYRQMCVAALAYLALTLAGCSGTKSDPLSEKKFLGTWNEIPGPAGGPGTSVQVLTGTAAKFLRRLEVRDDGTYTVTFLDPKGHALNPAQTSSGKWTVEKQRVYLEATDRKLAQAYQAYEPTEIVVIGLQSAGATEDFLEVRSAFETLVKLRRAK